MKVIPSENQQGLILSFENYPDSIPTPLTKRSNFQPLFSRSGHH